MRKIGIDARLYFQTGVGVYLRNFLHFLQELDTKDLEFYIYVLKSDSLKIFFERSNFIKKEVNYKWHSLGEQTGFLKKLYDDNLDLMHFTYFSYPIFYTRKFIATIHDTILLQYKTGKASTKSPLIYDIKHHAAKLAFSRQIQNSAKVITPSQTIKNELINIYGKKYEEKIAAIYEGVNYELIDAKEDKNLSRKFKKNNFFIYVGNFYPHKNIERLVQAFSQVGTDKKLVLVGGEDYFMMRLKKLIDSKNLHDKVIFFSRPTIEQLVFFYKNASALIHPSISEGFCLPLVEASYFKLPIIGSNIPVFKEVIGDNYVNFNPYDTDDIKLKIENFLTNKKNQVSDLKLSYSFKSMAQSILDIYESI